MILAKQARQILKGKLPGTTSHGYDLIHQKLPHLTRVQIEKAFNSDAHYKDEVMRAALLVIEEAKAEVKQLENKIKSI